MPRLPEPPPGLEKKANTILADLTAALGPIQASYQATYGRYWQGLRTHATLPKNGDAVAPDASRRPTDQAEDWTAAAVPLPAAMEIATAVDTYDGPAGQGWVVVGEIEIARNRWQKAVNVGPETWRQHDWREVQG